MTVSVELIEPVDIIIEQIDKTNTPFPDGASGRKFPMNHVVRATPFIIEAQVVHGDFSQTQNHTQLGTDEQQKGYLVLRFEDLNNKGKTLQRGDKITKMGQLDVELYLSHSSGDPAAQIGGSFQLVKMFFLDRNPVGGK